MGYAAALTERRLVDHQDSHWNSSISSVSITWDISGMKSAGRDVRPELGGTFEPAVDG
jgi:hypothetical protein